MGRNTTTSLMRGNFVVSVRLFVCLSYISLSVRHMHGGGGSESENESSSESVVRVSKSKQTMKVNEWGTSLSIDDPASSPSP